MDATEQSPSPKALPSLTKVPIAQLSPALEELEEKCIYAVVTLVWPYSSSTKSLSLLLSEPDFRLRRSNGQVKATFLGRVAEDIAKSQVGIGDSVRLALKGAEFIANDTVTQTPGRCVAWDIHFEKAVSVEINRSSQDLPTVIVEQHIRAAHDTELAPPSTPRAIEIDPDSEATSGPGSWGSPAFLKSARSSYGAALDTAYDPFNEEDGTVPGKGRKKPRYGLRREEWRILDEPDSPREREGTMDLDQAIEDELNIEQATEAARDAQPQIEIQPHETAPMETQDEMASPVQGQSAFVKPLLEQANSISGQLAQPTDIAFSSSRASSHFALGFHLPTDTPQLRPIPSPGLPIPSPITTNHSNAQEYFSASHTVLRTPTTQHIATETNSAADIAQDAQATLLLATQQQAIPVRPEEPVFSQSHDEIHRTVSFLGVPANAASSDPMGLFDSPTFKGHTEFTEPDIEMAAENRGLNIPTVEGVAHSRSEQKVLNQAAEEERDKELGQKELKQEEHEQEEHEQEEHEQEEHEQEEHEQEEHEQEEHEQEEHEQEELEQEELEQEELQQVEHEQGDAQAGNRRPLEAAHGGGRFDLIAAGALQTEYPPARASIGVAREHPTQDELGEYDHQEADPAVTDTLSVARPNPSLSPDYSEDESQVPGAEALYDEEDAAEYTSEDDEDRYEEEEDHYEEEEGRYEEEDEDGFDKYDVGLPQQPQAQNVQPEVIVLDSDSEDELASDQQATMAHHPVRHESGYEESFSQSAGSASDDEEQDWSAVDEEPDYDKVHGDGLHDAEERVDDSDVEDESSVDVLAWDGDGEADSMIGSPTEHEDVDVGFADEGPDGSLSEEDLQDDANTGSAPEHAIDVSSDVEEPQEAEMIPMRAKEDDLRLAEYASKGRDGADDRGEAQSRIIPEEYQSRGFERAIGIQEPEVPRWDGISTVQTTTGSPVTTHSSVTMKPGLQQLPTRDPTQEAVQDRPTTSIEEEQTRSPALAARGRPSAGIDHSLGIVTDAAIEIRVPQPGPNDTSPAVPALEAPPDNLSTAQQLHEFIEADVAVPSTSSVPVDERETNAHLTIPTASTVPITRPPVPDRHAHGLRSKLSYFAPLATLIDHYNALVDTISVVHETTPVAKAASASKDYYVTIQLTDPSMAGTTLQAQIFRRYKSALPVLVEGNVILLRNFKVRSYDHSIMLVSVESSSWAVFDGSSPEAQINGPPVEYGSEERAYTSGLRRWYREVGAAMVADNKLQAAVERDSMDREPTPSDVASSESGSMTSIPRGDSVQSARSSRRSRKSHRRVTIHELRDGTRYTEVGSPSSKESIHELRDGTVYANL